MRPEPVQFHSGAAAWRRCADAPEDDRGTPATLFAELDREFRFTIDVCASAENAKCANYYDYAADGLARGWAGESVWCNPPYSGLRDWVEKAWRERYARSVVMLIPAPRTEQPFWQELIEPFRDQPGSQLRVRFLPKRAGFIYPGSDDQQVAFGFLSHEPAEQRMGSSFGNCLLIWEAGT